MSDSRTRLIRKTISMLSSMVESGEQHSTQSKKMMELANKALDGIEDSSSYKGKPNGWVVLPDKLTAENGAKFELMGAFHEDVEIQNPDFCGCGDCDYCRDWPEEPEFINKQVMVSWSTIKDIYDRIVEFYNN